jgi:hypothetical protein
LQAPFSSWLGRWQGEGRGLWEADPPFRYLETLVLEPIADRALLRFDQCTFDAASGELSHSEVGFVRLLPEQLVELVLAIPTGYVEIHAGRLLEGVISLRPHAIAVSPTATPVRLVERRLELQQDVLHNAIALAIGDQEVQPHVESVLHRSAT